MIGEETVPVACFRVRTFRVGIPLADLRQDRERMVAVAFAPDERDRAATATNRTLAGHVAAKRALNGLAGRGDAGLDAWAISTAPDGAPSLVRVPVGRPEEWRLSISHSRTTAWALAARSENGDSPRFPSPRLPSGEGR